MNEHEFKTGHAVKWLEHAEQGHASPAPE